MHKYSFLFLFLFSIFVQAQNNRSELISSNTEETIIDFYFDSYSFNNVMTPNGKESIVVADGLSAIMEKGAPDLPKYTESLIIPDFANMQFEILDATYKDITNKSIAPSKGNFLRTVNPNDVDYTYGSWYTKDTFYPNKLASLNTPYILRDYRGQALQVFPFQYNPVSKVLRVYTRIKLKISIKDNKGTNTFIRNNSINKVAKEYNKIYSNHFINYTTFQNRYTPLEEEGNMLIICHDAWTSYMQDFVTWKNTIGRPCEMVTVTDAGGTATNIKTYVENYYNTNGLTYLLLVGDAAQVPTNSGGGLGGHSDNAYGYITGSDHYQEFFVGRFSAEDPLHVMTQSLRTIEYEKGDQLANDWLNKLMSVGSNQGPGDDGEMDYEHLRNIQTDLLSFTYLAPPYEHFDGSQGGEDAAGDPSSSDVAVSLNSGLGIVNYTGHGSTTSWGSSGFSVSNINSLTNDNKLPFIWSVACVNGAFVGNTCFGEAWLRAENAGEPTGGIAIMASTINQSWAPPMIGQDEMNDLLVGTASNGTKRTFAGLSINGCFQMIEESSDFNMIDTWTCFGDPSLYVRTDNPTDMIISHNSELIVGDTTFNVSCDLDGALATISNDGVIVGSAVVAGGLAAIPVSGLTLGTTLTLAVVGFNKVTYLTTVVVIAPSGSYLVVDSYENTIIYGTNKNLDISIKNVGVDDATNVNVVVASTDPKAIITDNTYNYGTINAGSTSPASTGALNLSITDDVPDQHLISINIDMSDDTDTWTTTKNVIVNAPAIVINELVIDDSATGNNDGILDPGETADLIIQTSNIGHADVDNVISLLATTSADLTINSPTAPTGSLAVGESKGFVFNVTANSGTALGTEAIVTNNVTAGATNYYSSQKEFTIIIGFIPEYCESNATNSGDTMIEEVQFGSVVNNTAAAGCTTYSDFTEDESLTDAFAVGTTNDIKFFLGTCNGTYTKAGKVYIDWNYDGDFDDANEMVFESIAQDANWLAEGTFTVPTGISSGPKFMRIVISEDEANINPCGTYSWGETEDYKIYVFDPLSVKQNTLSNVNIYPNPNKGIFIVDFSNQSDLENTSLSVYNINGQLVYKTLVSNMKESINLNSKSGLYFIKINSGNQITYKKIIIN
jgi:hypothetical protein